MSMTLFDTHAHLDDEQFASRLPEVIANARTAGVDQIIVVGTTADSSERCVEIAGQFDGLYAAVGIQPNYTADASEEDWSRIKRLIDAPQVKALGETGLDRYWDYAPFEVQEGFFRRHIQLSTETGLPFIVHMRDCNDDILRVLGVASEQNSLRGVMHSFTGDTKMADACLEMGLYISFAGMVTFKKSEELRGVAEKIPADRLLLETDSPYLSPHPKRGQRPNEPSLIVHTAECLADVRRVTVDELSTQTSENAKRLFGL